MNVLKNKGSTHSSVPFNVRFQIDCLANVISAKDITPFFVLKKFTYAAILIY